MRSYPYIKSQNLKKNIKKTNLKRCGKMEFCNFALYFEYRK